MVTIKKIEDSGLVKHVRLTNNILYSSSSSEGYHFNLCQNKTKKQY